MYKAHCAVIFAIAQLSCIIIIVISIIIIAIFIITAIKQTISLHI